MPVELMSAIDEANATSSSAGRRVQTKMHCWLLPRKPGTLAHLRCWSNGTSERFFQSLSG